MKIVTSTNTYNKEIFFKMQLTAKNKNTTSIMAQLKQTKPVEYGDIVSGLLVGSNIPNIKSIEASLVNWRELGLRAVNMSDFDVVPGENQLANEIKTSGRIDPLIVIYPENGDRPYVLEGSHRIKALATLGVKQFPALVVQEITEYSVSRGLDGRIFVHKRGIDKPISYHETADEAWNEADRLNDLAN